MNLLLRLSQPYLLHLYYLRLQLYQGYPVILLLHRYQGYPPRQRYHLLLRLQDYLVSLLLRLYLQFLRFLQYH